jgi:hypothetical protein
MLCKIFFIFILLRILLRPEEAHVFAKMGEARKSARVRRGPSTNANRCSEVLRLWIVRQKDSDAIVKEKRAIGAIVAVALNNWR